MMLQAESFPDHLCTPRFELRRYGSGDAAGFLRLIERNRERLIRDFPELARGVRRLEDASAYVEASGVHWAERSAFIYGVWRPSEGGPIGQLRVKNISWSVPSAELSYFIDREWLRKGVATEVIRAAFHAAFDACRFRRVYVRVIAANEESLALARRLKLHHEGVHRNAFRCGFGELHDVHLFAMTDIDYRAASLP